MSDESSDLQAEVAALRGQVTALEEKVAAIEARLSNMPAADDDDSVSFPAGGPGP